MVGCAQRRAGRWTAWQHRLHQPRAPLDPQPGVSRIEFLALNHPSVGWGSSSNESFQKAVDEKNRMCLPLIREASDLQQQEGNWAGNGVPGPFSPHHSMACVFLPASHSTVIPGQGAALPSSLPKFARSRAGLGSLGLGLFNLFVLNACLRHQPELQSVGCGSLFVLPPVFFRISAPAPAPAPHRSRSRVFPSRPSLFSCVSSASFCFHSPFRPHVTLSLCWCLHLVFPHPSEGFQMRSWLRR